MIYFCFNIRREKKKERKKKKKKKMENDGDIQIDQLAFGSPEGLEDGTPGGDEGNASVHARDGGGPLKKQRTWERHRWSYKHDELLFEEVIKHEAWSRKFGGILKSWGVVGEALEHEPLFKPWGKLKTDMLRRRFDKLMNDYIKSMRTRGIDLDALHVSELSKVEKYVLKVRELLADSGVRMEAQEGSNKLKPLPSTPSSMGGGMMMASTSPAMKKSEKAREEELGMIKDTIVKFLDKSSKFVDVEALVDVSQSIAHSKELVAGMKVLNDVDLDEKVKLQGDLVEKVVVEQFKLTKHLVKQNDLLLALLTKVLAKTLQ